MQSIYALKYLDTAAGLLAQPRIYTGVYARDFGNPIGPVEPGTPDFRWSWVVNRLIRFKELLCALVSNTIYTSADNGQTWSSAAVLPDYNTAYPTGMSSGFIMTMSGQKPMIFITYLVNSGDDERIAYSYDAQTWNFTGVISTSGISSSTMGGFPYWYGRNYFGKGIGPFSGPGGQLFSSDFSAMSGPSTMVVATPGFNAKSFAPIVLFNNRMITASFESTVYYLWEFVPASTSITRDIYLTGGTSFGWPVLWVDDVYLYAMFFTVTLGGYVCWRYDSSFNRTDVTSTIIPNYFPLRSTGDAANSRIYLHQPNVDDPSSMPETYFYVTTTGDAGFSSTYSSYYLYKWNGPNNPISFEGLGGSASDALSTGYQTFNNFGGFVTDIRCIIVEQVLNTDSVRLKFQLFYENYTTQTGAVTGYFSTNTEDAPTTKATLIDPSHGTLNNSVNGNLPADNGITTYEITWDCLSQGITDIDQHTFVFSVVRDS